MELLNNLASDSAFLYAVVAVILSGVLLLALRYASSKTGIPTSDIQDVVETIHEQAKKEVSEGIKRHSLRDPKTGKFVSTKKKALPANKRQADTPKTIPKDEEQSEDKEPASRRKKTVRLSLLLLFILPFSACSLSDAVKYAKDNIQITWKGEEAKGQPIDSIVIKSEPVYWKEYDTSYLVDSVETETEFVKDGYRVWQLRTPNWKRLEVQRLDTVIYIYKK